MDRRGHKRDRGHSTAEGVEMTMTAREDRKLEGHPLPEPPSRTRLRLSCTPVAAGPSLILLDLYRTDIGKGA